MSKSARASLRWRLPLLILALLAGIGAAFTWTAYREMRYALRAAADERIQSAAAQLAELLTQTAAARLTENRRLAADPAVRRFVLTGEQGEAAMAAVRSAGQRNAQGTVRVQARGGDARVRLAIDNVVLERDPLGDNAAASAAEGVGDLEVQAGKVSYRTIARVTPAAGEPGTGSGLVSFERPLTSAASVTLIQRLIGGGAVLKFGNTNGDVWTDLSVPVAGPPVQTPHGRTVTFADSAGAMHIGTAMAISGTPWQIWVEFSESSMLQPARTLLRRMLPWTIGLIVLGVVAVWRLSARITAPLERLADAADAIASGDYDRRVVSTGTDEIGRLGTAFNLMAARVAESHEALEARVTARANELSQSREEMDQFFSMSLDLLCIADVEGRFTRVNPGWEEVLGWTATDLTASPYTDLVHPDDVTATARETAKLAAGGETVNFENRYRTKDGRYRSLSWKAAASLERGLVFATARDVTDERRLATELEQYAAAVMASNRELEAFSYSVSHDLRAPLRSIDGFSQALLEDCGERLGPDGEDHLRRIRGAAQHMGRLIDDLLKLARVSRADLHLETIDLSAMATTTLATLSGADQDRSVEWRVQPGLRATGDPRLVQIALTNLLDNAWKFTSKRNDGHIEFGMLEQTGEYFVRDNGAGFDATYATKLFSAFQRLHQPKDFPGTGIGLATVQRIVTRHGGRVRAEGVVGHGATFAFTLHAGLPTHESHDNRAG